MGGLRLCFVGPGDSITLRRWAGWFAARGHDTTVLTVEPASDPASGGLRQITLGTARGPAKLGRLISAGRLRPLLHRLRPDVVHAHYVRGLAWGLLLARYHPCVVTPWGSDVLGEQGAFREGYSRWLTRGVFRVADLVTVHSSYMETRVRPFVPAATPVVRIGWGVDLHRFHRGLPVHTLRKQWNIPEDSRVVFSPRLAQRFYNHHRVIEALPLIQQKIPQTVLVITEQFVDPDYVAELRDLAARLGVHAHVRFVGKVPYEQMPQWYNLADAVVMVPRSDGMPNTLWEAMACGAVPVLGHLPQYDEVVRHGENGFLVEPDGRALADALIEILSDPGLRSQMGQRNRALAVEFADQENEMSRMEDLYRLLAACGMHS